MPGPLKRMAARSTARIEAAIEEASRKPAPFIAGRNGVRPASSQGFLHPAHPPAKQGMFGAEQGSYRGRDKAIRRLSVQDEPISTVANFARATRRQNKEYSAQIHPLSGRITNINRGGRHGVSITNPVSRARQNAENLLGSSNSEVRDRAARLVAGDSIGRAHLKGPRMIDVHNHPKSPHMHRANPSSPDVDQAVGRGKHKQNVVVSLVKDPKRGGKNTSAVWHGQVPGRKMGQLEREDVIRRDLGTVPKPLQREVEWPASARRQAAVSRGIRGLQRRAGRIEGDYDADFARRYGRRQAARPARGGAKDPVPYYQRQTYLKRDDRKGDAFTATGVAGLTTAASANRVAASANKAKLRIVDAQLQQHKDQVAAVNAHLEPTGNKQRAREMKLPGAEGRNAMQSQAARGNVDAQAAVVRRKQPTKAEREHRRDILGDSKRRTTYLRRVRKTPAIGRTGVGRMTAGGLTVGAPALWLGQRTKADAAKRYTEGSVVGKRSKSDVDREAAGAAAGVGLHQASIYGTKGIDRKYAEQIAADPKLAADWKAHRAKHGNPKAGDLANKPMMREYPEHLPGSKWKRGMSRYGAGKTGLAVSGGFAATGVAAVRSANRPQQGASAGRRQRSNA